MGIPQSNSNWHIFPLTYLTLNILNSFFLSQSSMYNIELLNGGPRPVTAKEEPDP